MLKKFKVHTTHGVFEFTGRLINETRRWHLYDTDTGTTLRFRKEHIIMVDEGKQVITSAPSANKK